MEKERGVRKRTRQKRIRMRISKLFCGYVQRIRGFWGEKGQEEGETCKSDIKKKSALKPKRQFQKRLTKDRQRCGGRDKCGG